MLQANADLINKAEMECRGLTPEEAELWDSRAVKIQRLALQIKQEIAEQGFSRVRPAYLADHCEKGGYGTDAVTPKTVKKFVYFT